MKRVVIQKDQRVFSTEELVEKLAPDLDIENCTICIYMQSSSCKELVLEVTKKEER